MSHHSDRHAEESKGTTDTYSLAIKTLQHIKTLGLKPMIFSISPIADFGLSQITQTVEGLDEYKAGKKIASYHEEHMPLMKKYDRDDITPLEYFLKMGELAKRHGIFTCTAGIGLGLHHIMHNKNVPNEAACWVFSVNEADHELLGFSASGNMSDMVLIDAWLVSGVPIRNSMARKRPETLSSDARSVLESGLKRRGAVKRNAMVPIPFLSGKDKDKRNFLTVRTDYSYSIGEIRGLEHGRRAPDMKMSGPSTSSVHGGDGATPSGPKQRHKKKQKQPTVKEVVAEKTVVNEEELAPSQSSGITHSQIESLSQSQSSSSQSQVSPLQLPEVSSQSQPSETTPSQIGSSSQPQSSEAEEAEETVVNTGKSAAQKCLETTLCAAPALTFGYSTTTTVAPAIGLSPAASCVAGTLVAGGIAYGLRPTFFGGRTRAETQEKVFQRLAAQDAASFKGRSGPRAQTMEDSKPTQKNKPVQEEENLAVKKTQ